MIKLKAILHCVIDWIEGNKGIRTLKLIKIKQSFDDGYKIVTTDNFDIAIFCREFEYKHIYSSFWARSKKMSVYHVYCVCSGNTPEHIKDIFKEELRISAVLNPWSSKDKQKKEIISVFIDLAIISVTEAKLKA
jgi:hypothetical protein